jgi:pimeloyl-ACP methyl ester carboxylesterase
MNRIFVLGALILAACGEAPTSSSPTTTAGADPRQVPTGTPSECPDGTTGASGILPGSGALYLICVPQGFDPATGSLVVYAHGSVPPQFPLALPNDDVAGTPIAEIVTGQLHYAYATTSYRENGLVVVDAEKDLARLVAKFRELYGPIGGNTYAVGASEGGLIATLATERHPELFDGTLALCAPIGDFQRQINYFNDYRLAVEHFLQETGTPINLGNPIAIPAAVIANFTSQIAPAFIGALLDPNNFGATAELLQRVGIPVSLFQAQPVEVAQMLVRLLAYNILFTNDAQRVLGGQPYDNVAPTNYPRLTAGIDGLPSIQADQPALSHLRAMYQTSGRLSSPLVTLYNALDPIVPSWNETVYAQKVAAAGASEFLVDQIQSENAFGHCNFTMQDVVGAFGTLTTAVSGAAIAAQ